LENSHARGRANLVVPVVACGKIVLPTLGPVRVIWVIDASLRVGPVRVRMSQAIFCARWLYVIVARLADTGQLFPASVEQGARLAYSADVRRQNIRSSRLLALGIGLAAILYCAQLMANCGGLLNQHPLRVVTLPLQVWLAAILFRLRAICLRHAPDDRARQGRIKRAHRVSVGCLHYRGIAGRPLLQRPAFAAASASCLRPFVHDAANLCVIIVAAKSWSMNLRPRPAKPRRGAADARLNRLCGLFLLACGFLSLGVGASGHSTWPRSWPSSSAVSKWRDDDFRGDFLTLVRSLAAVIWLTAIRQAAVENKRCCRDTKMDLGRADAVSAGVGYVRNLSVPRLIRDYDGRHYYQALRCVAGALSVGSRIRACNHRGRKLAVSGIILA